MNLRDAQAICRKQGFTLKHAVEWGEYIVKESGARDDAPGSYHTNDIDDAVGTMWAMVGERRAAAVRRIAAEG